ncbi:MAG TPA: polymer-forming cytoskeletal protein [Thermoanaerobaculia bacterium]|nr:polymer-forming cytoskeletal protein [Thermoanaerobaculia bacterium]
MREPERPANPPTGTPPRVAGRGGVATIGPSISIKGDVVGDEDLLVEGKVEGEIRVKNHSVTVGRSGQVKADVYAKSIHVEGEVFGSLYGQEDVAIRQSGKVQGNIIAPRVTLEDGSTFRGSIDMRSPEQAKGPASATAATPVAAVASQTATHTATQTATQTKSEKSA